MKRGVARGENRTRALTRSFSGAGALEGALKSGYFRVAALDAARPALRKSAGFAVNVDRGGSAAQIVVIGKGEVSRAGHPLRHVLELTLGQLDRQAGTVSGVGGPAPTLQDFESETWARIFPLVLVLMLLSYVVLVPLLRSLLLPLLAVILNVLAVAAAFGVLVVLFQGDNPLLGGPGFIDSIMVSAIVSIVFGLSIDYEVFLLARMREGYRLTGSTDGAIEYGLRHTAAVVTGAAAIMTAVFGAFALSDLTSIRQLGIGLSVAVVLDATLVRLVLLPAAIRMIGDRVWWMPEGLARLLPGGSERPPAAGDLDELPAGVVPLPTEAAGAR